jgi:hypothetical protein
VRPGRDAGSAFNFPFGQKKNHMKAMMIVLSFVIAYPVFMVFVYLVARIIFTPLDKAAAEQEKERFMLLMKARRIRRKERGFVTA